MTARNNRPSKEQVRTSILLTARNIAATEDWSAVTVRKVAERIGYTAPIIYEHFGSKDEMLNQILKEGYDLLYKSVVEAVEKQQGGDARITAILITYWDFAHTNTELYQLMYGMEGARASSEEVRDYAIPLVKYVSEELQRFDPENIRLDNVVEFLIQAWSMLHGMLALDISGYTRRYIDSNELPEMLVTDVLYLLKRHQNQTMV